MNTNYSIFSKIILFLSFLFVGASCAKEAEESKPETVQYLPAVVSSKSASQDMINEILGSNRMNGSTSIDAVVAKYEGYEELEFMYIADAADKSRYTIYVFRDGALVPNFKLALINLENSLIVEDNKGKVIYTIENNYVTDIQVIRNDIENQTTTTYATIGDVFQKYLDCSDAITDQASDLICGGCGFGKWAFGIACGAWPVCRGATIVGCTAIVVSQL